MSEEMRENYDIGSLNPRPNPYAKKLKKAVTINISTAVINYFKEMATDTGIAYQTLINMYLEECVRENKKLNFTWK